MSDFCIQKIKFNKNVKIAKIKKHCRKMLGKKTIVVTKTNIVINLPTKIVSLQNHIKKKFIQIVLFWSSLKKVREITWCWFRRYIQ